jgi:hypothetical protein
MFTDIKYYFFAHCPIFIYIFLFNGIVGIKNRTGNFILLIFKYWVVKLAIIICVKKGFQAFKSPKKYLVLTLVDTEREILYNIINIFLLS